MSNAGRANNEANETFECSRPVRRTSDSKASSHSPMVSSRMVNGNGRGSRARGAQHANRPTPIQTTEGINVSVRLPVAGRGIAEFPQVSGRVRPARAGAAQLLVLACSPDDLEFLRVCALCRPMVSQRLPGRVDAEAQRDGHEDCCDLEVSLNVLVSLFCYEVSSLDSLSPEQATHQTWPHALGRARERLLGLHAREAGLNGPLALAESGSEARVCLEDAHELLAAERFRRSWRHSCWPSFSK
jgi:hypothetical protein